MSNRAALAGQLRAAYLIGREEPLKLLLNQQDPALAGRMFVYYSYFGRARAGQIKLIEDDVQRIAELDERARRRGDKLAELEKQQRAQLGELEHAREQRSAGARQPRGRSRTRARRTSSACKSQQAGLEKLLRELRAAMERFPVEGERRLHAPARQARLAGERAAGGALRRCARRRRALGRGAGRHRARHAGARRCATAG